MAIGFPVGTPVSDPFPFGGFRFHKFLGADGSFYIASYDGTRGADTVSGAAVLASAGPPIGYGDPSLLFGDRVHFLISGAAGKDRLSGGSNNDQIEGWAGNDTIDGLKGDDTLAGGAGRDTLRGGDGDDLIAGDAGNDKLDGGVGNDTAYGGAGNDRIVGGSGADTLGGDDGADTLLGGKGDDQLVGGLGDDSISGENGNDIAYGGWGNDVLRGGKGDDFLDGEGDDDLLDGGEGNDLIVDYSIGANRLIGGAGNDTLRVATGNDTMTGGPGADVFVFDGRDFSNVGADRITDFAAADDQIDMLDLTLLGQLQVWSGGPDAVTFRLYDIVGQSLGSVVVEGPGAGTALLDPTAYGPGGLVEVNPGVDVDILVA